MNRLFLGTQFGNISYLHIMVVCKTCVLHIILMNGASQTPCMQLSVPLSSVFVLFDVQSVLNVLILDSCDTQEYVPTKQEGRNVERYDKRPSPCKDENLNKQSKINKKGKYVNECLKQILANSI